MPKTHPDTKTLEKFGRGKLTRRENLKLAWHLFNCAACREQAEQHGARELLDELFVGLKPLDIADAPSYEAAFSSSQSNLQVRSETRDRDRERAPKLFAELVRHPVSRQKALIQRTWRFKNYVFGEYLLEQSYKLRMDEPHRSEDLAELALVVAEQLEGSHYGAALINDLKAQAWAYIGNARRIATDLRSAQEALQTAQGLLPEGSGDPLLNAKVLAQTGLLRKDQGKTDESLELIDRALAIYREAGENHLIGRTLFDKAVTLVLADHPDEAVKVLDEAVPLIDFEREPRLLSACKHNYAAFLCLASRYEEAEAMLPEIERLVEDMGNQADQVRVVTLRAQIAQGLGHLDTAEELLREARDRFAELEIGYDAALVSLDLAELYAQQGRTSEIKQLAQEMLPIFRSRDVHREALAALILFQKAAQGERVTLDLVQRISSYLKEARRNPELRYRGSF